MSGSSTYTLYSYWRSSCSYRVRIVLHHKGLGYTTRAIHLVREGGEQFGEEYRGLNPMAQVPTLMVPDGAGGTRALTQSVAICEYLEARHPSPPLLPAKAFDQAEVRQIVETIGAGIQPIQNLAVMRRLSRDFGTARPQNIGWAAEWITQGFEALERMLKVSAGAFACGDSVTLADVFIVPQVYNANRFGVDMSRFPILTRVHAHAQQLDSFARAAPERQPDAAPVP